MYFYSFARPIVKNLTKSAAENNDSTSFLLENNGKLSILYKYSFKKMLDILRKVWYNDIVEECPFTIWQVD